MPTKHASLIVLVFLAGSILTACAPAQDSALGVTPPQAWFDAPLPYTSFPFGPVPIVAHGSDPAGITQFELTVNGNTLTIASPELANPLVKLTYSWVPPQLGTYQLLLRALNTLGEWSPYTSTVVIVANVQFVPERRTVTSPSPTPTRPPSGEVSGSASIERTRISSAEVFYAVYDRLAIPCGQGSVTIQARAVDPQGVKVVMLFYRLVSQAGNGSTAYSVLVMSPAGQDIYQATLVPQDLFEEGLVKSFGPSWLQYQLILQNDLGETLTRSAVFSDLVVSSCSR